MAGPDSPAGRADLPFDGPVLLLVAAKASVGPERLPVLLAETQADLASRIGEYRRRYEVACETPVAVYFFVDPGHWAAVADRLGFDDRAADAVRRTHHEQLLYVGRREGREEEFESALEIRDAVVVGR